MNAEKKITISDYDLAKILRLSRQTISSTKKKLKSNNLIDFTVEKGKSTTYAIFSNNACVVEDKKSYAPFSRPKKKISKSPIEQPLQLSPIEPKIIPPTLEEFMQYAKTLKIYDEKLNSNLKLKYETWIKNGWKKDDNAPIFNWRISLKNAIHCLDSEKEMVKLPSIIPPKINSNK